MASNSGDYSVAVNESREKVLQELKRLGVNIKMQKPNMKYLKNLLEQHLTNNHPIRIRLNEFCKEELNGICTALDISSRKHRIERVRDFN